MNRALRLGVLCLFSPLLFLDLETTGLSPTFDKIVEIAAIRCTPDGDIEEVFVTLVNPQRKTGSTHGIKQGDVRNAPLFGDIACNISRLVEGAVVVAHNFFFDWGFIVAESKRIGFRPPDAKYYCTLDLAREMFGRCGGTDEFSLPSLCRYFAISHRTPHHAESDARATKDLLFALLEKSGRTGSWPEPGIWRGEESRPVLPPGRTPSFSRARSQSPVG